MSAITLHPVAETDAAEVLRFELENRAFFERPVAGFGDDYYTLETVRHILAARVQDREEDESYFYLIRDPAGELVGRVNLFDVQRGPAQMAQIGYRIAEKHSGKGYATAAVGAVLKDAFEVYGLHRVEAATSPKNIGLQLVLLKNGFEFWGRARRSYLLNGVWEDTVMFERLAG
jgi:[ribosomal protein S5]-alanine N-acetyltransferase